MIETQLPLIVYTHSDMEDVWEMFFCQLEKYLPNFKTYVCLDKATDRINSKYKQVIYDDTQPYTERWKSILPQIEEEVILFLHEDMVLIGEPNLKDLEKFYNYIDRDEAKTIKLIFAGSGCQYSSLDRNLVTNEHCKLSIQPTILKKETFSKILNSVEALNIWQFESAMPSTGKDYMVRYGTEPKRGSVHFDSLIFPYIATAITKGKWLYSEYPKELEALWKEYNITQEKRGTV
tara:strand:+ start:6123 stop:6824 length:702 start_codon:yes stop_codon:yes gene_type:complete